MHISAARHVRLSSVINHNRSARQLPGKKKADLRACSSKFELMIFIDLEWDNATDANNLTWPLTLVLFFFFLCFFGSQYWSVVVGGGWRENGKLSQMAAHIYLRKPHLLSALLVSAMWVRPCLCLPNVGSQQKKKKKKSKECKWEGRKWLKSLKSASVCQRQVSLRVVIQ